MRTNRQRRLKGTVFAPFLLLLCVTALSPATTASAQARQEVDRNDESTRSVERSSDSSSSRSDSSPVSNNSSNSSSSSPSSNSSSSSSSSSSNDSSSSVSNDSGSTSGRRSGGDEGRRGGGGRGGGGKGDGEGRPRNREHPGWGSDNTLGSRKSDKKDKDDDHKRDRRSHDDETWREDESYRNSSAQSVSTQDECQRGFEQGLRTGASDARRGQPNDPYRSRHYKNGGGGFFSWGRGDAAKQSYRDCFLRGYQEGFQNPNLH